MMLCVECNNIPPNTLNYSPEEIKYCQPRRIPDLIVRYNPVFFRANPSTATTMLRSTSCATSHVLRRRRQRSQSFPLSTAVPSSSHPLNSWTSSAPSPLASYNIPSCFHSSLPSPMSLSLSLEISGKSCRRYHSLSGRSQQNGTRIRNSCSSAFNENWITSPFMQSTSISTSTSTSTSKSTSKSITISKTHTNLRFVQKRNKVFVSRYNNSINLSPHQITNYAVQHLPHLSHSGDFRVTGSHVVFKECPFCAKPTGGKADNLYKLYVKIGNGAYFCHRCGAKGSWFDFKSQIGGFCVDGANLAMSDGHGDGVEFAQGVEQPWNWNTSNNQGMGYVSTKHLRSNGNGGAKSKVECLPMPSRKSSSIFSSRLFDPSNSPVNNAKEFEALEYLTKTRGLDKRVLRKYGVGCANYKFFNNEPSSSDSNSPSKVYVDSMCVTFPWIMRASEVATQEEFRGATFEWRQDGDGGNGGNPDGKDRDGRGGGKRTVVKPKHESELTALEKHQLRQERKARRMAKKQKKSSNPGDPSTSTAADDDDDPHQHHPRREPLAEEQLQALHGPWIPRRIKVRSIESKSWQRLDPAGGGFGLFGWHTVPADATEIIVTEGEFDAMAVYQATGRPAVSLPNGCRSLPQEVLVLLEKFDTIYLWMDNDGPGREGAEMFAKKLGVERCLLVQPSGNRGWTDRLTDGGNVKPPPPKDANEALLNGWNLNELLEESSELPHEKILRFSDLRDQVIHEIVHPEKYRGAGIASLPGFTSLIKGFRRGEMTVLTGPTGSGKTTFLGQTSLDLAEQGINVLWGSFEVKNTRLMHKLLQQYMKDVLPIGLGERTISDAEKRDAMTALTALADEFETLPMYFMKFHGGSEVDDVLDAMEYAAYVHDVEHIILDNLQFMISRQAIDGRGSSFDKFDMQDMAIEKFRKFATDYNVHVTLVVHPRKEDEGAKLGISSFYGSAKATQEADTILILQSDGKRKFIEVKKNRFDGTLGHVPLYFQRKSGRYTENPDANNLPQTTVVPRRVGAVHDMQQLQKAKASLSSSMYNDIRGQHPT
ncbi:hypothetical protein ACHAXS_007329 [Conticribra weissflogii]